MKTIHLCSNKNRELLIAMGECPHDVLLLDTTDILEDNQKNDYSLILQKTSEGDYYSLLYCCPELINKILLPKEKRSEGQRDLRVSDILHNSLNPCQVQSLLEALCIRSDEVTHKYNLYVLKTLNELKSVVDFDNKIQRI